MIRDVLETYQRFYPGGGGSRSCNSQYNAVYTVNRLALSHWTSYDSSPRIELGFVVLLLLLVKAYTKPMKTTSLAPEP